VGISLNEEFLDWVQKQLYTKCFYTERQTKSFYLKSSMEKPLFSMNGCYFVEKVQIIDEMHFKNY